MSDQMTLDGLKYTCPCVADHNPNPIELHVHHIFPLGMGGLDVPENEIPLCPTTHANVHRLLRAWRKQGGEPSWDIRKRYSAFTRDMAEQGYRLYRESLEE